MQKRKTPTKSLKTRQLPETRVFPKNGHEMTTRAYIAAYHAANASVYLTQVTYTCQ